jgi:hypothetical protein
MELPYDFSLSHHQLLFTAIDFITMGKYGNIFFKNKQNDNFTGYGRRYYRLKDLNGAVSIKKHGNT